ncbi:MAG: mechanosensitive ion channel [Sulfurimonas sp.]|nr:mechanosensitive ion channel [Sulfurimonas sp.]
MKLFFLLSLVCFQTLLALEMPKSLESAQEANPLDFFSIISWSDVLWTILLFIISYFFMQVLTKTLIFFAEKSSRLRITIKSLIPILRIGLWTIIIVLIIKVIYNPPIGMLMTALASVAIAVGFAAQDLLKNIFGGLMLLFDRPFKVGDKIGLGEYYGEVINIGLRTTRIVTDDDSVIVIPNMDLMNRSVSNTNAGELYCQVVANIALPIDIDTQKVRKIAIEAAQVSKYVYLNKPIVVLFSNKIYQRKSFLDMQIQAYVMDIRYEFPFKSDMTEIVLRELLKQKIVDKGDLE